MNQDSAGGKFDQVAGKIKQGVGEAFGSEKLANEGAAEQVKGNAKEAWGNVKDTTSDLGTSHTGTSAHTGDSSLDTNRTGSNLRDSVASAAEHAKDSINRGLDNLKGSDRK